MGTLFIWIIAASLIGGVVSLVGGFLLLFRERLARRLSLYLVSLAIGALLGAAFFDLLPESLELFEEQAGSRNLVFGTAVAGIIILFIFEKFLKWYHCHEEVQCSVHTWSSAVILGDAIHNFIDGVVITISFFVSTPVGVATTAAVFFHEIPQEIGDFGVLLHAGYKRAKIIFLNTLTALATPLGAVIAFFIAPVFINILPYFLTFAAGGFIYIAVADLLPQIQTRSRGSDFSHLAVIILGIAIIFLVGILVPE